jgi:hypothetical protein
MGASPADLADAADATSGPAATVTVSGETGTTEPLASVTMSETVKVPGTPYECAGFWLIDVVPSPKAHL